MADKMLKKRRIDENFKISECCICGKSGYSGYSDTYQLSLRESNFEENSLSFVEVIFYVVGINVQKESSEICAICKPKIIEFYHFKKRSQSLEKKFSPLLQEIMKIVGNYISKNSIKAVTIEEDKEKLVIMEKIPSDNLTNLKISEVSSICEVQIKQESNDENDIIADIEIKKEPQDLEEIYELPAVSEIKNAFQSFNPLEPSEKLDMILNINKEILELVTTLKHNINEQKNLIE